MILPEPVVLAAGVVSSATPIILAVIGETITEKAGVINLSLDGTILLSAMVSFVVASQTGNLILATIAAAMVGGSIAGGIAFFSLYGRVSQVAIGFIMALMAKDAAYFLGNAYARINGPQFGDSGIPLLRDLPFVGPVLFDHNILVYVGLLLIPFSSWLLYSTRAGLNLRAIGENPLACYARGLSPRPYQVMAAIMGGALVGISGAAFSLCFKPGWGRPQGAEGTGWIVLALVIFGGWNPIRASVGAYFFAMLQIIAIHLQTRFDQLPATIFQIAPFPLMISTLLLIQVFKKGQQRKNTGRPGFGGRITDILWGAAPASLGKTFL
ncbi:MAG: ABC transporter permease [Thermodesulfobacteriota bacterium]